MAVAFDAASHDDTSADELTVAHTCTGDDRLLLVWVSIFDSGGSPPTPTVTYDGVSMDQEDTVLFQTSDASRLTLFSLVAPATGGANIVVSVAAASDEIAIGAVSLTGADQTTPLDTPVKEGGDAEATTISNDVTSEADDLVVDGISYFDVTATVGADQTERVDNDNGGTFNSVNCSTEPGDTTVTMSWSFNTNVRRAQIAVNVNAAAAGGANTRRYGLSLLGVS